MNISLKRGLHESPLLRKIEKAVGKSPALPCLKRLAVERGCLHYENTLEEPDEVPVQFKSLTNEELGVALCLDHFDYDPINIRIAAEVISSNGVSPEKVALLAVKERCQAVVAHIAQCGQKVEPNNPFWKRLLDALRSKTSVISKHLSHWSRFVSMTGLTRNGGRQIQWLRP